MAEKKKNALAEVAGPSATGLRQVAALAVRIDDDFYGWLRDQASALRDRGRALPIDWEPLAEELDAMGRSEESSLQSFLERLLKHLLKYAYQSDEITADKITGSWENSIEGSRLRIDILLKRSPSLKNKIGELFEDAYRLARGEAGAEMGMRKRQWEARLPESCPWPLETVLDADFWPSPAHGANGHN